MSTTAAAVENATALRRSAAVQLACMGQFQAKQIQQETDQFPTLMCVYVAVLETRSGLNQPSQHVHTQPDISTLTQTVSLHVANIYIYIYCDIYCEKR